LMKIFKKRGRRSGTQPLVFYANEFTSCHSEDADIPDLDSVPFPQAIKIAGGEKHTFDISGRTNTQHIRSFDFSGMSNMRDIFGQAEKYMSHAPHAMVCVYLPSPRQGCFHDGLQLGGPRQVHEPYNWKTNRSLFVNINKHELLFEIVSPDHADSYHVTVKPNYTLQFSSKCALRLSPCTMQPTLLLFFADAYQPIQPTRGKKSDQVILFVWG